MLKRIVITGSRGFIGWHAHVRLHSANCAAAFKGEAEPFEIIALDHKGFNDDNILHDALDGAQAVLHFAGVNRAPDNEVEVANSAIACRLANACSAIGARPHIVYANSIHADYDTPYGRSKRMADKILSKIGANYTNLVLPHLFGECARSNYNNVTATLIDAVISAEVPAINPNARVSLLHAGTAAQIAVEAALGESGGTMRPNGRDVAVSELYQILNKFHKDYQVNIFPDFNDIFMLSLFNSYRAALYPNSFPKPLDIKMDVRGSLFEAIKGGGGQIFLSTTKPGVTRGNHFHLNKVERFLVVRGEALIRIRKALSGEVWEYRVSGDMPASVDMPTLHTHSIENIGNTELLTLFWTNELFDAAKPDTYADRVLL